MSTQIQKYTAPVSALSKDLQQVTAEVTLNYQLKASSVPEIYRSMRQDYENRVMQPNLQEAVKSTTADFDAEELITQRPQVKEELQNLMTERLAPLGIEVVQLSITDFQFSSTFQESIEAKVKAVQQALEAENALRRVEFEAQQAITRAKAEAKGLELQKAQITEQLPGLAANRGSGTRYRQMEWGDAHSGHQRGTSANVGRVYRTAVKQRLLIWPDTVVRSIFKARGLLPTVA